MSAEREHLSSLIERFPAGSKIRITGIVEWEKRAILETDKPPEHRKQNPVGQEAVVLQDSSERYPGVPGGTLKVRMAGRSDFHIDENCQIIDLG
jgi:hypothetical protein